MEKNQKEEQQTVIVEKEKTDVKLWDGNIIGSFVISGVFIIFGFYKMFAYKNDEMNHEYVNVYVGGDAYNYIINANFAAAFFILALIFTVIGCTLLICNHLKYRGNHQLTKRSM